MIQTVTIRQQILAALQRVYDSMAFDDQLSADRVEKELFAEFSPTAFALTPADGLDEISKAAGYVKLADDEMIVKQLKTGEVCFGTVNVDQVARKFGYIKLQPGQVVVNESTHSLVLHMAAKWAEHVAGNDRGVTFTRTSNLEARDE